VKGEYDSGIEEVAMDVAEDVGDLQRDVSGEIKAAPYAII